MSRAVLARQKAPAPVRHGGQAAARAGGLRIGRPDDAFEREADRAADAIMAGDARRPQWSFSRMSVEPTIQRKCDCGGSGDCEECKSAKTVLRKASGPSRAGEVPPIVHDVLRSRGKPLDAASRAFFEPRFGHDFSRVRVHADERAARSAQAIAAFAYTAGNNVVFGSGQYAPDKPAGRRLLGHELAHVVQQGGAQAASGYSLLPPDSRAEQEAGAAGRVSANGRAAKVGQRVSPSQIARADKKEGETAPPPAGSPAPGPAPAPTADAPPPAGAKPQRLRFDILGADTDVADILAKQAGVARDPDLRVVSLEDMINQLEAKAPAKSNRCIEHINIFNHGSPYGQPVAGPGGKKVPNSAGTPEKLPRSGFYLPWLYDPANQGDVARLRGVFCCNAEMAWMGCATAGVLATGGKRTEAEIAASKERFEEDSRDEYRSETEALEHGANQHGVVFGKVNVQSWADATCTSIRASNDFMYADYNDPAMPFKPIDISVGGKPYRGEILNIKPTDKGNCSCDAGSGRVQGTWRPAQGIDRGDAKWREDLEKFNKVLKPDTGSPDSHKIKLALYALLFDISSELTIPSNIPHGSRVEPQTVAPSVFAYTFPHLIFCFPDDCWKWIGVSPEIIQTTPAYTKTILNHELQHASDLAVEVFRYKLENGGPPKPTSSDVCLPSYVPKKGDPYGDYLLAFKDELDKRDATSKRHVEISTLTATPNFSRFTPAEKASWFASMLTTVPEDVPARQGLPSEPLVAAVFEKPVEGEEEMRNRFTESLINITREFLGTYSTPTTQDHPSVKQNALKALTLVNHFIPVWDKRLRAMLEPLVKVDAGKERAARKANEDEEEKKAEEAAEKAEAEAATKGSKP